MERRFLVEICFDEGVEVYASDDATGVLIVNGVAFYVEEENGPSLSKLENCYTLRMDAILENTDDYRGMAAIVLDKVFGHISFENIEYIKMTSLVS